MEARQKAGTVIADVTQREGKLGAELSITFRSAGRNRRSAEKAIAECAASIGFQRLWGGAQPDRARGDRRPERQGLGHLPALRWRSVQWRRPSQSYNGQSMRGAIRISSPAATAGIA